MTIPLIVTAKSLHTMYGRRGKFEKTEECTQKTPICGKSITNTPIGAMKAMWKILNIWKQPLSFLIGQGQAQNMSRP